MNDGIVYLFKSQQLVNKDIVESLKFPETINTTKNVQYLIDKKVAYINSHNRPGYNYGDSPDEFYEKGMVQLEKE